MTVETGLDISSLYGRLVEIGLGIPISAVAGRVGSLALPRLVLG